MYKHTRQFVEFCIRELEFGKQVSYNYQSLSICIVDCVYSLRSLYYSSTIPVVNRYAACYLGGNTSAATESVSDLIQHIQEAGGPAPFAANILENNQLSGHVLKAEVCLNLAKYLKYLHVETMEDFKRFEAPELLETVIHSVKGMGDAGTNYLFMLAGDPNRCKPDVHIHHCIRDACGEDISNDDCQLLFSEAVQELKRDYPYLTVAKLDGIIWRKYQGAKYKKPNRYAKAFSPVFERKQGIFLFQSGITYVHLSEMPLANAGGFFVYLPTEKGGKTCRKTHFTGRRETMDNCQVVVLCNQKGGVGKSFSTASLGVGLARARKKVLLVDADPQGSLGVSLGIGSSDELEVSLSTLMAGVIEDKPLPPEEGILHHREGVDLLPANIELSGLEMSLFSVMSREFVLRNCIEPLRQRYDYILIDCMPSLGIMTVNALVAADSVIIPSQPSFLSAKGLDLLLHTVAKVRRSINPGLKIDGVLLTMVDSRTNNDREIVSELRTGVGQRLRIFDTMIPRSIRAVEATRAGESIFAYEPNGKVAQAYAGLTKEVLDLEGRQKAEPRSEWAR